MIRIKNHFNTIEGMIPFITKNIFDDYLRFTGAVILVYVISFWLPNILLVDVLLRSTTGLLLITVVPGLLVWRIVKRSFRPIDLAYAIALSVALSMALGWSVNSAYHVFSWIPAPFEGQVLPFVYGVANILLWLVSCILTRDRDSHPRFTAGVLDGRDSRVAVTILLLPAMAVAAALLLNRTGSNFLVLSVILLSGVLVVTAVSFDKRGRYFGVAIVSLSYSMILLRSQIWTNLAFGDGLAEFEVALTVLERGYWIPFGTKGGMPRLGILHPASALVMDIPLLWEFRIVHPLVFAITPVIGYLIARRFFSPQVAFLGASLFVVLPETYRLLPRNTRTGSAIFFAVVFIAVVLDLELDRRFRFLLAMTFFWGVITSHYAIGPVFLILLGPAWVFYFIASMIGDERPSVINLGSLVAFGVWGYAWYAYLTTDTFNFVSGVIVGRLISLFEVTGNTAAVNAISFEMPSLSYEILFYAHLLIAGLCSMTAGIIALLYVESRISISLPFATRIRGFLSSDAEKAMENGTYLSIVLGFLILFPLSFGPNVLSSARTFGFLMGIVAPFAILALRLPRGRLPSIRFAPAVILVLVVLLFTSGFVSATVTHDVSRVPNFDRDRIIESGDQYERNALYQVYVPPESIQASAFALDYFPARTTIQSSSQSGLPLNYHTGGKLRLHPNWDTPVRIISIGNVSRISRGVTYIGEPDTVSGRFATESLGFVYYETEPLPSPEPHDKIYTSGDSYFVVGRG